MLYELKMRLTSPWLGQQRTNQHVRRFRREKDGRLMIDTAQWQWALQEAAEALHIEDIDIATIRTESGFDAPTLQLFNRRYSHKGKPHEEMFESIRENTILTFNILVTKPLPIVGESNGQRQPDIDELNKLFGFVGKMIGLSPWGTRFGFGKFTVEQITAT